MWIALYQPEIAGNVGAVLRTAACFGVDVAIVEPCGFAFSDRALRRAGMDYADAVTVARHADWAAFQCATAGRRTVLLTTRAATRLDKFAFRADDILVMGCESAGVSAEVRASVGAQVRIGMRPGLRSLNLSVAAGIALAEALRQTTGLPE